ncbi:MAG: hypothetical protein JW863_18045 [Chitinispirillaceae bacterium]|nr:hypothetical protein [Chitinispirillaceae bacterium]
MSLLRAVMVVVLLLLACTPQPGTRTAVSHETCPPVSEQPGDTLGYTVTFSSWAQREQFVETFRSFLKEYPFTELRNDTVAGQVVIHIAPYREGMKVPMSLSPVEQSRFSEGTFEGTAGQEGMGRFPGDSTAPELFIDTIIPQTGGTLKLYLQRTGIDGTFLPLVTVDPFIARDSVSGPLFSVSTVSPKKITLAINGRLIDGTGRVVSALDLIEAWTGFVKKHPAEGLALFRNVEGIKEFVAGREAVIRGIGAVDQNTCYFRLSKRDTLAVRRITTRRLCGSVYSKIGPYFPLRTKEKKLLLLANTATGKRRALLDTLVLSVHDDNNPILSFSLKKYDAITLITQSDLSYARSTLDKQASLEVISNDRYFISCAAGNEAVRSFVASHCNGADLLRLSVKGVGRALSMIATDTDSAETTAGKAEPVKLPPAAAQETMRILFREDDAVSRSIAEKLLADLSAAGMRCELAGSGVTEYERALVERKFGCAVGWVPREVLTDEAEQLRLATLWFQDNGNEADRIARHFEIPLFAVDRYLLLRRPAGLFHGKVDGMFASSEPLEVIPR